MTRKKWLGLKKRQNCFVKSELGQRYKFNRNKFNRMDFYQQEIYEAKMKEKKEVYYLYELDNCFYEITKIEFNYFNTL